MTGKTILVIDTDTETIQKIMSTLESEGYLVFAASSTEVCISMAKKVNPSLIFINVGMTGVSGLEICKTIHNTETLKNVPIVIITPHTGTIDSRHTSLYGIVDFLTKPFSPEELISKTKDVLAMKFVEVQPIEEEIEAQPIEEEIEIMPIEEEVAVQHIEEEISDVQKKVPEETVSEKTEIKEEAEEIDEEKTEPITRVEHEETLSDLNFISQMRDSTHRSIKSKRRSSKRNRLFVPIIVLVLLIISTAGILLYRGLRQGPKVQTPVLVKPLKPVQQQAAKVEPFQEQQKPQQAVEESKPVPPAPEAKSEGKPIYSVQIGVFKNEANSVVLTKKYKERGYDSFTHKSTTKDKGILYRVLIGKFENKKEASKLANSIRAKEKINVIIFHE